MSFYWITRLDALNTMLILFANLFGKAAIALIVFAICWHVDYAHKDSAAWDEEKRECKAFKISAIITSILLVINLAGAVFVPTTKEMCAIYVVDYLQTNEEAKQLPDKMIKAANAYFDELAAKHANKSKDK